MIIFQILNLISKKRRSIKPQIKVSSFNYRSFYSGFWKSIFEYVYSQERILYVFILSVTVRIIIVAMYLIINYQSDISTEKKTAFECGFEPLREIRIPFSMRFFILIILFLIFDIEISLIFPIYSVFLVWNVTIVKLCFVLFILILLIGLFHEWNEGALDWTNFKDKL